MDIGMTTTDGDFSLRAAALIIDNGKLLAVKNDNFDCFYTVGGGVTANETSADAVVREVFEETGHRLAVDRLVFIQERFYKMGAIRHHEVVFFYLMKPADISIEDGTCTDREAEKLYWLPIEDLQSIELVPEFLKTALADIKNEIVHIVSRE